VACGVFECTFRVHGCPQAQASLRRSCRPKWRAYGLLAPCLASAVASAPNGAVSGAVKIGAIATPHSVVKSTYSIARHPRDCMPGCLTAESWIDTYVQQPWSGCLGRTDDSSGSRSSSADKPEPLITAASRGRPTTKKRKGDGRTGIRRQAVSGELPRVPDRAPPDVL